MLTLKTIITKTMLFFENSNKKNTVNTSNVVTTSVTDVQASARYLLGLFSELS